MRGGPHLGGLRHFGSYLSSSHKSTFLDYIAWEGVRLHECIPASPGLQWPCKEQLTLSGPDATRTSASHHSCLHGLRAECPGQKDKAHSSGCQASSPIFHGLCWSWTQPLGWTQQIQDKNRPLAGKAGFPQSALSPNGQSKCCWLGLKSQPAAPDLYWPTPRRPQVNSAWTGLLFHSFSFFKH